MTRPNRHGRHYANKAELRLHPNGRSVTIVLDGMVGKPLDSKQAALGRLNLLSLNGRIRHRDFMRMSGAVLLADSLVNTKREAAHARARANHDSSSSPVGVLFDGLNRDYGRLMQQRGHGRDHRTPASQR